MPYVVIPRERLKDLPLFGYTSINFTSDGAWVSHPEKGDWLVEYKKPKVWVDDVSDAIQLDALGITIGNK